MADLKAFYRIQLQKEYDERLNKNPRYSKNSFVKFLGITPSYYSKLMGGKILLSLELADKISKKLGLSSDLRRDFILSVADEQRCHALYLIDPSLTSCDPECTETNKHPKKRS